ncbi:MAG: hypothetical protein ACTHOU_19655 [Aureliella sp.]
MNSQLATFCKVVAKRLGGVALVTCSLALVGCGSDAEQKVELFPASGRVTHSGAPLADVQIILHAKNAASAEVAALHPHGKSDAQGSFRLSTYVSGDGAPAGQWKVTLSKPDQRLSDAAREQILANGDAIPDAWRGRYSDPIRSPWQVTIQPGDNQLPPIDVPSR